MGRCIREAGRSTKEDIQTSNSNQYDELDLQEHKMDVSKHVF